MASVLDRIRDLIKEKGLRGDSSPQSVLVDLLAKDREDTMRKRSLANISNREELDAAMKKAQSGSKALSFLRERTAGRGKGEDDPRPAYREVYRIAGLEIHTRHTDAERSAFQEALIQKHARERGFAFKEQQVEALLTFDRLEGLFGPIGVGHGKTFISILCAALAFERGVRKSLLMVPPEVFSQLVLRDIPQARRDLVLFGLPFHYLGGETRARRRMIVTSDRRGCYIMPYSLLSVADTSFMLDTIQPELIIADEAHCLKNLKSSARSRRVRSYLEERDPKMVALSGTMTSKSVMDYWHLLVWCLGPGSALPLTQSLAIEWAGIIDSETSQHGGAEGADTGPLIPLIEWARANDKEHDYDRSQRGFRRAYAYRLRTTPGVVMSGDASCNASLLIHTRDPGEPSAPLKALMDGVVNDWLTPQGEPIEFGLHKFKWLNELTCGFWHELFWPEPGRYARTHRITVDEAVDRIARAKTHHEAAKLYHSELSKWLRDTHIKGVDTPMLVANHVRNHFGKPSLQVSPLVAALYMGMHELDFPERPERERRPVLVDDYKLRLAVEWAKEKGHGIVWYHHQAVGSWLVEAMRKAGLDPLHCPAGDLANKSIAESAGRLVVASSTAHHTGKNLQFHTQQLIVQWPRPAKVVEQLIGRTHRLGQEADSLTIDAALGGDFDFSVLAACLTDALYTHQSGGGEQKLVVAAWDPLPPTVPTSVMIERGIDPTNAEQAARMMARHFSA